MEGLKNKADPSRPQPGPLLRRLHFPAFEQHTARRWAIEAAGKMEKSGFPAPAGSGNRDVIAWMKRKCGLAQSGHAAARIDSPNRVQIDERGVAGFRARRITDGRTSIGNHSPRLSAELGSPFITPGGKVWRRGSAAKKPNGVATEIATPFDAAGVCRLPGWASGVGVYFSSSPSSLPCCMALRRSSRRLARSAARFTSSEPTSSSMASSAPSPFRNPMRTTRV